MNTFDHDVPPINVILSANGQAEFGPLYHQFVMYQPNLASDKDFERVPVSVIGLGPTRANLEAALSHEAEVVLVDADLFPDERELLAFLNAQLSGKVALVIVSAQKRFLVPTIRQVASVRQIALKGELRDTALIHTVVQLGLSERAARFVNTPASVLYDQVSRLASPIERVNALAGTRVFAIAGSKGGPGKSTIALNFAARLSQRGLKTLLISFDTPCGIWAQLGLPSSPNALNWFRRPGREGFEASRVTTKFGLDVILSPNDTAEAAAIATSDLIERLQRSAADRARAHPDLPVAAIVSQAADEAQREAAPGKIAALIDAARDYHPPYAAIVCDLPPTLGTEWSIQPLLRASVVLCVIEPSRADAMNLLNAVRILTGTLDPRYRVPRDAIMAVLNRVTDEDELNANRIMEMIRPHLNGWAPPFIATIPHDPLVRQHQVNFVLPIDKRDAFRKGIDTIVDTFYGDALAGRANGNGSGKARFGLRWDQLLIEGVHLNKPRLQLRTKGVETWMDLSATDLDFSVKKSVVSQFLSPVMEELGVSEERFSLKSPRGQIRTEKLAELSWSQFEAQTSQGLVRSQGGWNLKAELAGEMKISGKKNSTWLISGDRSSPTLRKK